MRIAVYFSIAIMAGAIGGVVAHSVSEMDGILGLRGWQWMFLIEAIPTILIGFAVWFYLPNDPQDTRFLSGPEKQAAVERLRRDNNSCEANNSISKSDVVEALKEPLHYLYMILYFCVITPMQSISLSMPLIVRGLGYEGVRANLMSAPPFVIACLFTLLISYRSDRTASRSWFIILSSVVAMTGFVLMSIVRAASWQYAAVTLAAIGVFPAIPVTCGWLSSNIQGHTKRAVGTAMVVSFGNLGGIVSGLVFREADAPFYLPALFANIGILVIGVGFTLIILRVLKRRNARTGRGKLKFSDTESDGQPDFEYML